MTTTTTSVAQQSSVVQPNEGQYAETSWDAGNHSQGDEDNLNDNDDDDYHSIRPNHGGNPMECTSNSNDKNNGNTPPLPLVDSNGKVVITESDVLLGRGVTVTRHAGNQRYRTLVTQSRGLYVTCARSEKAKIAAQIVQRISQSGGRFLEKSNGDWKQVSFERAQTKTAQALREGQPEMRRKMFQLSGLAPPPSLSTYSLLEGFGNNKNNNNNNNNNDRKNSHGTQQQETDDADAQNKAVSTAAASKEGRSKDSLTTAIILPDAPISAVLAKDGPCPPKQAEGDARSKSDSTSAPTKGIKSEGMDTATTINTSTTITTNSQLPQTVVSSFSSVDADPQEELNDVDALLVATDQQIENALRQQQQQQKQEQQILPQKQPPPSSSTTATTQTQSQSQSQPQPQRGKSIKRVTSDTFLDSWLQHESFLAWVDDEADDEIDTELLTPQQQQQHSEGETMEASTTDSSSNNNKKSNLLEQRPTRMLRRNSSSAYDSSSSTIPGWSPASSFVDPSKNGSNNDTASTARTSIVSSSAPFSSCSTSLASMGVAGSSSSVPLSFASSFAFPNTTGGNNNYNTAMLGSKPLWSKSLRRSTLHGGDDGSIWEDALNVVRALNAQGLDDDTDMEEQETDALHPGRRRRARPDSDNDNEDDDSVVVVESDEEPIRKRTKTTLHMDTEDS